MCVYGVRTEKAQLYQNINTPDALNRMAEVSQFSETLIETLFEEWDAAEPNTKELTKFGIASTDLYARYSYYSKLISDRAKWEQDCNQHVVDFNAVLNGETNVDPELMVKVFVQQRLETGDILNYTQQPANGRESSVDEVDELEIPVHVIKRKKERSNGEAVLANNGKPKFKPNIYNSLPLRIRDILEIPLNGQEHQNVFELFGIRFRLVTFFGRIVNVTINEKWNQKYGKYTVDDGSQRIVVHFNHLNKGAKNSYMEMAKIEQSLRLKKNRINRQTSEDIRMLLRLSKALVHRQLHFFSRGDRVLVLGVPFRIGQEETRVFGYEMSPISHEDCDFEIYFKELLFKSYLNRYFVNKDM